MGPPQLARESVTHQSERRWRRRWLQRRPVPHTISSWCSLGEAGMSQQKHTRWQWRKQDCPPLRSLLSSLCVFCVASANQTALRCHQHVGARRHLLSRVAVDGGAWWYWGHTQSQNAAINRHIGGWERRSIGRPGRGFRTSRYHRWKPIGASLLNTKRNGVWRIHNLAITSSATDIPGGWDLCTNDCLAALSRASDRVAHFQNTQHAQVCAWRAYTGCRDLPVAFHQAVTPVCYIQVSQPTSSTVYFLDFLYPTDGGIAAALVLHPLGSCHECSDAQLCLRMGINVIVDAEFICSRRVQPWLTLCVRHAIRSASAAMPGSRQAGVRSTAGLAAVHTIDSCNTCGGLTCSEVVDAAPEYCAKLHISPQLFACEMASGLIE